VLAALPRLVLPRAPVDPAHDHLYLTQWRLQLAARMLADRSVKVAAVARDVGYQSKASFGRAFQGVRRRLICFRYSGHEREEQERCKEHQMHCPLHHVSATGAESDGAHQERHREHPNVRGLQAQDQGQLEGDRSQHHNWDGETNACERGADR
jgi:AraC-like DNA-binding protein